MKKKTAKKTTKKPVKAPPVKKAPQRIKGWDSNRWGNSSSDGIA